MSFIKPYCLISFLIINIFASSIFATEIYRSVDEQGRVTYSDKPSPQSKQIQFTGHSNRHLHHVAKVYDGDTVILENGKHVRLLGINTPEIEGHQQAGEPGGIAAKKWLQEQLQDNKIYLEYDQLKQDKYKRTLAHLYLSNGKHLNLMLLENGLATMSIIPPNLQHAEKFLQAQQHAEKLKLGIWSMPEYQPRPIMQISTPVNGWQRLIGTPVAIKKNRKYTRLVFTDKIDIRIANINLNLFPALASYLGKSIEMRGWVGRNKDHYTMLIQHPSAIVVLQ
jgi:endonuclease YncB( thermonuclease family)